MPVPLGPRNLAQLVASAIQSAGEIRTKKVKQIKRMGTGSSSSQVRTKQSELIITSRISKNKGLTLVNSRILSIFLEASGAKLGRLEVPDSRMQCAFFRSKHEESQGRKECGWQVEE